MTQYTWNITYHKPRRDRFVVHFVKALQPSSKTSSLMIFSTVSFLFLAGFLLWFMSWRESKLIRPAALYENVKIIKCRKKRRPLKSYFNLFKPGKRKDLVVMKDLTEA
ncbi:unnamed protein product [Soboliphyme baturini]|uniref:Transmembrane protein n=1 Tax=Soboliphyme baturini TaxID=241478 RepID=A0A183J0V1_9BILA|nr:unnamed protein product [Soboliphyme baturini]